MPALCRRSLRGALLIPFAAGALAPPARALDPGLAITQYVQTGWRAPGAIPHDNVTSILQSRDGYLWVGTVDGLARFDGVRSRVFDRGNTPALRNNWIRALLEDRQGRLWIATLGGGLACRVGEEFVRFGPESGLESDSLLTIFEDRAGRIWVGAIGGGVYRLEGDRFRRIPGAESLDRASVWDLAEDDRGLLWLGTERGLFSLDGGTLLPAPAELGLGEDVVTALVADGDRLWVGTATRGLRRLAGGRLAETIAAERLVFPRVWALGVDSDHSLWIGTDGGGLHRWANGRLDHFGVREGLPSDYVWAITEDAEKGLWVGMNWGGIVRLKVGTVTTLTSREGLPSDFTWSVTGARDGALWVGTEEAGVARLSGGTVEIFGAERGFAGSARALFEASDGRIWAGGNGGLFRLDAGRFHRVPLPPAPVVQALTQTPDGTIWIGWNGGGLDAWRDRWLGRFTGAEGLSANTVNVLFVGSDGTLWIGTSGGLTHRSADGAFTRFGRAEGLPSDYVTALFERPRGVLWCGTRGGLARLRAGRFEAATAEDGLFDDAIMAALPGNDRNLWLGGNRGIFSAPLPGLEGVLRFGAHGFASRTLGREDGLKSIEINQSGSSAFEDRDGRLWFATRVGVASFDPQRIRSNPVPPKVVIERVIADDRPLPGHGPWELPAGTRKIEFHFTALSFDSLHGLRIESRLEGFDPDWVPARQDRYAVYTSLGHGRYRFHVIATNGDGVTNAVGDAVELTILPAIWETAWFRLAAVAFFLVAVPFFYIARVRRLRLQKETLERLVAERTAEVAAANLRLAELARQDGLTRVANRRAFDEALEAEWRRAARQQAPLALLLVDVDRFKRFNDRLGHPQGDAALRAVAAALVASCRRAGELVARYGGEEFAALLPGSTVEEARVTANAVRHGIASLAIPHPDSELADHLTVSIGVAVGFPPQGGTPAELVEAADRALYRAKQGGRNRVESA